jgi:hypothetical protein
MIDTGTSNEDIVTDCENALTTNPLSISASDPGIMENSRLLQLHTTIVDLASKRHLVWMKVIEARFACDFIRMIAQDVDDGVRSKQNVRIRGVVWLQDRLAVCRKISTFLQAKTSCGVTDCGWS